jgi:predicted ATP-grasp superfamily ATP-dependent carboligase
MKILVFEWMVGGGMLHCGLPLNPLDPLLEQGAAMFTAIATDAIAAGHHVLATIDRRVWATEHLCQWSSASTSPHPIEIDAFTPELIDCRDSKLDLPQRLMMLADQCQQIIIIAPESDRLLCECYRWLKKHEHKIWGGPPAFVELTSNKNLTQQYLHDRGIAVPSQTIDLNRQWVAKPVYGAGSEQVQISTGQTGLSEFQADPNFRVEQFVCGKPVSVSIIGPGDRPTFLPPTGQLFSKPSQQSPVPSTSQIMGHYTAAQYPLPDQFATRATALAKRVVGTLPFFDGYIGIDMVLADTGPDVVIEINPRLTMSYCHLPPAVRRQRPSIDAHRQSR